MPIQSQRFCTDPKFGGCNRRIPWKGVRLTFSNSYFSFRAVSWFSKVNSMSKSRLPKLCLDRQLSLLDRRRDGQSWAQKLRGWFWEGGDYDGWNRLTAGTYNGDDLNDLILRLHVARRGRDRGRVLYSSHCPIYKFYANSGRELLESSSLPIGRIRVFYQLITINNKFQSIYWQGETSKFFQQTLVFSVEKLKTPSNISL